MEEAEDSQVEESAQSKFLNPSIIGLGLLAAFVQPIVLILAGKDINDAIWPHAYRALQATMLLRSHLTVMFLCSLLMFFASLVAVQNHVKGKQLHVVHQRSLLFILGLFSGFTILYFLLDVFYLHLDRFDAVFHGDSRDLHTCNPSLQVVNLPVLW